MNVIKMTRFYICILFLCILSSALFAQQRKDIAIPNIGEFITVKCEFHSHSIFSDGRVWPSIRVQEAWRDGLDAIAITDHVNYQWPFLSEKIKNDDKNYSYNEAKLMADRLGITLIRGAEINRSFPPGHFNVLFTEDNNQFVNEDFIEDLRNAKKQGAYIQWNHPDYGQKDNMQWVPFYDKLHAEGLINGIEVCNGNNYYPLAVMWAEEKKLSISCGSDVHDLIDMTYESSSHRPITLVFARDKSVEAIREAVLARRTMAYFDNKLVGSLEHLIQVFNASVKQINLPMIIENKSKYIQFKNSSEVDFELSLVKKVEGVGLPHKIILKGNYTTLASISPNKKMAEATSFKAAYKVENLLSMSGENVVIEFEFNREGEIKIVPYPKVKYPIVNY